MIVQLGTSLVEENALQDGRTFDAVESLTSAMARGEHYILGKRETLRRLIASGQLGRRAIAVLNWIVANYSFVSSLPSKINASITVEYCDAGCERIASDRWRISVAEIARSGVRPVVLLAENSVDAEIYVFAARHYLIDSRFGEVNVNAEPRNGNGSGVAAEFEAIAGRRLEWCLCITDSDLNCPEADYGINSKNTSKVLDRHAWVISHENTISRELENEMPRSVLNEVLSERGIEIYPYMARLMPILPDAFSFSDIKKGERACSFPEYPKGSPMQKYWGAAAQQIQAQYRPEDRCTGEACDDQRRPGCSVVPECGDGIGARALEILRGKSAQASYREVKNSDNFSSWLKLGGIVAEYSIAPKPMRI